MGRQWRVQLMALKFRMVVIRIVKALFLFLSRVF